LSNVCYCQLGQTQSIDSPRNHHMNSFQKWTISQFFSSEFNRAKIKTKKATSNWFSIQIQLIKAIVLTQDMQQQEWIEQFEFDIIIMNQHSSKISMKRSFAQVRYNPNPNENVDKKKSFFQFNRLHRIYQANSILWNRFKNQIIRTKSKPLISNDNKIVLNQNITVLLILA